VNKPRIVQIELTSKCNANCIYCVRELINPIAKDMDWDLFVSIVNEVKQYAVEIHPQMWGEPLLYPRFIEAVEYIRKTIPLVKIVFYTNGVLLTEDIAQKLIECKVDEVNFSIDTTTPELYKQICKTDMFETVKQNLAALKKMRKTMKSDLPKICVRGTKLPETKDKHTPIEFKAYWQKYCDKAVLEAELNIVGRKRQTPIADTRLKDNCDQLEDTAIISATGVMLMCCRDPTGLMPVGHVKDGILNVMNSEKYNLLHYEILSKTNLPAMCKLCLKDV